MGRKFIATILAAAIAVTSISATTTAAQAGDKDVARFIVGATALAIIGAAIADEQRKKNKAHAGTQSHYKPKPQVHHKPRYNNHQRHYNNHKPRYNNHGHKPRHNAGLVAPRKCLINAQTRHGWTKGYAVGCTRHNIRRPAALPSDCVRRNFANTSRYFYSARCLRRNGFNA